MPKHKHCAIIKAWADGCIIQVKGWSRQKGDLWFDCPKPHWSEFQVYRVKPEPKPDVVSHVLMEFKHCHKHAYIQVQWNGDKCPDGYLHNLNRGWEHLRFVFDGETDKLKEVKIL